MNRVIFVNRFYWPDTRATGQLLADLAEGLAAANWRVTVITSRPAANHPSHEMHGGVEIVRVGRAAALETTIPQKAAAFAGFAAAAAGALWRRTRRGDVVVTLTDPPLFAVVAGWIARLKGARLVHWIHDIYPEVAVAVSGRRWLGALAPLRNRAWRDADACITLSQEMADVVRGAGVCADRITIVQNWAPPEAGFASAADATACRTSWGLDGEFVVEYAGNLGRVHDVDTILAAATRLRGHRGVAFVFVGGGPRRAHVEAEVRRLGLRNVRLVPAQARDRLGATLAAGDVHLVTLREGCERFVFPSKLYGIAAAGRPVLFIGPPGCELARLVVARGLGRVLPPGDAAAVTAAIEELATNPTLQRRLAAAATRFAAGFDRQAAVARWDTLLQTAVGF